LHGGLRHVQDLASLECGTEVSDPFIVDARWVTEDEASVKQTDELSITDEHSIPTILRLLFVEHSKVLMTAVTDALSSQKDSESSIGGQSSKSFKKYAVLSAGLVFALSFAFAFTFIVSDDVANGSLIPAEDIPELSIYDTVQKTYSVKESLADELTNISAAPSSPSMNLILDGPGNVSSNILQGLQMAETRSSETKAALWVAPSKTGLAQTRLKPATGIMEVVIPAATGIVEVLSPPATGVMEMRVTPATGIMEFLSTGIVETWNEAQRSTQIEAPEATVVASTMPPMMNVTSRSLEVVGIPAISNSESESSTRSVHAMVYLDRVQMSQVQAQGAYKRIQDAIATELMVDPISVHLDKVHNVEASKASPDGSVAVAFYVTRPRPEGESLIAAIKGLSPDVLSVKAGLMQQASGFNIISASINFNQAFVGASKPAFVLKLQRSLADAVCGGIPHVSPKDLEIVKVEKYGMSAHFTVKVMSSHTDKLHRTLMLIDVKQVANSMLA